MSIRREMNKLKEMKDSVDEFEAEVRTKITLMKSEHSNIEIRIIKDIKEGVKQFLDVFTVDTDCLNYVHVKTDLLPSAELEELIKYMKRQGFMFEGVGEDVIGISINFVNK